MKMLKYLRPLIPIDTIIEPINVKFLEIYPVTATEIKTILSLMNKTTFTLDPIPT